MFSGTWKKERTIRSYLFFLIYTYVREYEILEQILAAPVVSKPPKFNFNYQYVNTRIWRIACYT